MPLTALELLRLRVSDKARNFTDQAFGDGGSTIFNLSNFPIVAASESVFLDGALQADPAEYSLSDDDGALTFMSAPADNAVILVVGQEVIFSDTELNDIIDRTGGEWDAVLEVITILMTDGAKRIQWGTNQGLSVDETMIAKNLRVAYDTIIEMSGRDGVASGGLQSWAINQELFV